MRTPILVAILSMLVVGVRPPACTAGKSAITREHHPWGRFEPGAWKTVRVVTETLDENGNVTSTSTTETKTTLAKVEEDGVTLQVEVEVEVAGRRFDGDPQVVKQGFHGELACQDIEVAEMGPGNVTIEGRGIPCQVLQLAYRGPTGETVTKVHFSDTVPPYILKRETVCTVAESKEMLSRTSVVVDAQDMPCKVLAEIKSTSHVTAQHKHAKGTTITLAQTSPDIPGGIVRHTSKELDKEGRLVRRSVLELVDYGIKAPERAGLIPRLRGRRFRKSPRGTQQ